MASREIGRAEVTEPAATVVAYRDSITGGIRVLMEDARRPAGWLGSVEIDAGTLHPRSESHDWIKRNACAALSYAMNNADGLPPQIQELIKSRSGWPKIQGLMDQHLEGVSL